MEAKKEIKSTNKNSSILIIIIFSLILFLAIFLRLYNLGSVPAGLTNDEANNGYDAYSILKTGKDQWGDTQPSAYLKGFGDNRLPLYTYSVIPSVAIFGLNEFAVRLPSAIFGILTVVATFFICYFLFNNSIIGLIAGFLLAVNPWHIAMSRVGIESNLGILIFATAVLFFIKAFAKSWLLVVSFALFGLTIYTYTAYTVFTLLFLILICIVYRQKLFTSKYFFLSGLAIFFGIILFILINGNFKTAQSRAKQTNFFNDIGLVNLINEKRGECLRDFPSIYCTTIINKPVSYISKFLANYLNHYSPTYAAITGAPNQYSAFQLTGLIYISEYLFALVGLYFLIISRNKFNKIIFFWLLFAPIPDSLTGSGHYSRFLIVLPSLQILSALGFYSLFKISKKYYFILPIIFLFLFFEIISFFTEYTTYFPRYYSIYSHYGYKNVFAEVNRIQNIYDKILISNRVNDTKQYIYFLFYNAFDPEAFQKFNNIETISEENGWVRIYRINNIYFVSNISITKEMIKDNKNHILLIGAPEEFDKKVLSNKDILDLRGNILFRFVDTINNPVYLPKLNIPINLISQ